MSADDFIKDNSEHAKYLSSEQLMEMPAVKVGMQISDLADAIESLHPKDYLSLISLFSETQHFFDDMENLLIDMAKIYISVLMNPNIKVHRNTWIYVEYLIEALIDV